MRHKHMSGRQSIRFRDLHNPRPSPLAFSTFAARGLRDTLLLRFRQMSSLEDKIIVVFYGLLGAMLAVLVFAFAFGGWEYVFTGDAKSVWIGPFGLVLCCGIGFALGLLAYKHKHRELDSGPSAFWTDGPSATLFAKRLLVIAGAVAALYFLWQLARSAS